MNFNKLIFHVLSLQKHNQDEELCSVFVPTNHFYIEDIFLVNSKDIIRPNLSIREGIGTIYYIFSSVIRFWILNAFTFVLFLSSDSILFRIEEATCSLFLLHELFLCGEIDIASANIQKKKRKKYTRKYLWAISNTELKECTIHYPLLYYSMNIRNQYFLSLKDRILEHALLMKVLQCPAEIIVSRGMTMPHMISHQERVPRKAESIHLNSI